MLRDDPKSILDLLRTVREAGGELGDIHALGALKELRSSLASLTKGPSKAEFRRIVSDIIRLYTGRREETSGEELLGLVGTAAAEEIE